ncbi:MAG: T9SS type A sorting domain-containing protein [bacterium]|nr:T9SS type A sorting domain-containing protein [bacterium]
MNSSGVISSTASYTNTTYGSLSTIALEDFNKDGWKDIVVSNVDHIYLFLNNKGTFSQTASDDQAYSISGYYFYGVKLEVADLQNKGALSVISSLAYLNLEEYDDEALAFDESVKRFNATDTDAVPAPAVVFKSVAYVNNVLHPKITMFSRGDRDFKKFKIYSKVPASFNTYILRDSNFTGNVYIDTSRVVIENETTGSPNLFYYVKCVDNSYKTSINSDTIGFSDEECPDCSQGESPVFISNNAPDDFKISNHPNPFNPSTLIIYSLPIDANVKITVFNTLGQIVKELTNEFRTAGNYSVNFDGSNFSSGIYYYRIEAGSFIATKKMLLLK